MILDTKMKVLEQKSPTLKTKFMNNFTKSKLTRLLRLLDKGKLKHTYFGQEAKVQTKNRTIHLITFVVEVDEDLTKDI